MDISIAPNLNAEVYRNLSQADRPTVTDKHLQLILVYDDNNAILGGSNMTDRFWSGTVWYYNDISDFTKSKALLSTKTITGITTGAYLEKDKFIIGEDSGLLQIIGLVETSEKDTFELQSFGYACQHDDTITSISVFSDKERLVSGGMDCCVKVWDISNLMSTDSFHSSHIDIVTGVDVQHGNNSVFISTSLDNCALMWDLRKSKPATCILEKYGYGLTSVSCSPISDNIVAIGAIDGSVTLIDIRNTDDVLFESFVFSRSIHKLLFNPNPERSSQLACCCDDVVFKVIDTNKDCNVIYENITHTDFVRGLAWYKDELLSCSWDDQVLKHTI
ncbi:PREDICTED: methylosome protein 50-like isoform X3 [Polistes dominula]|nr:PREDICTED: methylosome protein 50-like isoform X3 [Polistes dominula]XP_015178912.1 PREDICTED: methylosome protein 50-like isoform X3 [Polistes dominula]XP_015178913.1 PREDICTED: methylosome protein 50-like isoform X3 [Polistes dominula]